MDLFGKALLDYHEGERAFDMTIYRDDGHVDAHSVGHYFEPDPFSFEAPALAYAKGSVLDVGCGAGRHVLWMQRQGRQALGVDLSADAINLCKMRGCRNVHQMDAMAGLGALSADTITLFGNNAGIGGTFGGTTKLFRTLRNHVTKDGLLILTGIDIARTDNPVHLAYHAKNIAMGKRRGEIRMQFAYRGKRDEDWINWYHPEPDEVQEIAQATGWHIIELKREEDGFFWSVLQAQPKTL